MKQTTTRENEMQAITPNEYAEMVFEATIQAIDFGEAFTDDAVPAIHTQVEQMVRESGRSAMVSGMQKATIIGAMVNEVRRAMDPAAA